MKRSFVCMFAAVLMAVSVGAVSFASPGAGGGYNVKGTITGIEAGTLNVSIKDEAGKDHLVQAADPKLLQGINVGDNVQIKLQDGKAVLIQKVEGEDGPGLGGGY